MQVNALFLVIIVFSLLIPLCWYMGRDETGCIVSRAGKTDVNGYYSGYGGLYVQRGYSVSANLDIFSILALKRHLGSYSIVMSKRMWSLNDHTRGKALYGNAPLDPEDYLYSPPKRDWKAAEEKDLPGPVVNRCIGSLDKTAPMDASGEESNIGLLLQRPVTNALLGLIFAIAYYLWAYQVDPSAVAYSYEAVVYRGEHWRAPTASFAHFELLHLGFNTLSLYQLGLALEPVYGSAAFLSLNLALVPLTMLACTAMYHLLIHRYGRAELAGQQAVGFSCVLFAWMVTLSVRQRQYCPIFLFPSFCVDTWQIPLPSAVAGVLGLPAIPINVGPFALLLFTKLLIPRSSFIGHLSGIVIGYPLAWGLLNWLTLPVTVSCLAAAWVCSERAFVWTFPGYAADNVDLNALMTAEVLRHYKLARILSFFLAASVPAAVWLMGVGQLLPRLVLAFLAWSAAHACRVEKLLTSGPVKEACGRLMVVTVWFTAGAWLYDACTLAATIPAWQLLVGNGLSDSYLRLNMYFLIFMLMVEGLYALLLFFNTLEAKGAGPALGRAGCGAEQVVQDLRLLCLPCSCCSVCDQRGAGAGVTPFSGTAHRLSGLSSGSGRGVLHV